MVEDFHRNGNIVTYVKRQDIPAEVAVKSKYVPRFIRFTPVLTIGDFRSGDAIVVY